MSVIILWKYLWEWGASTQSDEMKVNRGKRGLVTRGKGLGCDWICLLSRG